MNPFALPMSKLKTIITTIIIFGFSINPSFAQATHNHDPVTGQCIHQELMDITMKENPKQAKLIQAQEERLRAIDARGQSNKNDTEIIIPVVIHVLYNSNYQNISNSQIYDQMSILNDDFNRQNSIQNSLQSQAADVKFTFQLADEDPNGLATTGIIRKFTSVNEFPVNLSQSITSSGNRQMKEDANGGSDAWPNDRYLNIWVINMSGSYRGFATPPNLVSDEYDGVVMNYQYFGSIGTGDDYQFYDGGRTLTHEVGHWLNLNHIWGSGCGSDDGVVDTPNQSSYTNGCPGFSSSCGSNDLWQNFMDYTYDDCMQIFTEGQKTRMRAVFEPGGGRSSFQHKLLYGLIGDLVWTDINMDGIHQLSEPGEPNVVVNIYDGSYNMIGTQVTDANGNFLFSEVQSGDYFLEFVPQGSSSFTMAKIGGYSDDSDVNHANGINTTDMFSLAAGEYRSDIDAGIAANSVLAADYIALEHRSINDQQEQLTFVWEHNEPIESIGLEKQNEIGQFEPHTSYESQSIQMSGIWEPIIDKPKQEALYRIKLVTDYGNVEYSNVIAINANLDLLEDSIEIYPNPAHEIAIISLPKGIIANEIRLIDSQGRWLKTDNIVATISEGVSQFEMDCSTLVSGMYYIQLKSDKTNYVKRLYVVH